MDCHAPTCAAASDPHGSSLSENRRAACYAATLVEGGPVGAADHVAKVES